MSLWGPRVPWGKCLNDMINMAWTRAGCIFNVRQKWWQIGGQEDKVAHMTDRGEDKPPQIGPNRAASRNPWFMQARPVIMVSLGHLSACVHIIQMLMDLIIMSKVQFITRRLDEIITHSIDNMYEKDRLRTWVCPDNWKLLHRVVCYIWCSNSKQLLAGLGENRKKCLFSNIKGMIT